MLQNKIKQLAKEYFPEIQAVRQHLHAHPELSFEEHKTAAYLIEQLEKAGLSIDQRWVETGFSVVIDSGKPGASIALRADMDALPIQEKNEVSYRSNNDGVMHACGHDVHSSCLLGAAKIISALKGDWSGKVILFFQAGEEKLPGGASLMIKEGIMEKYQPQRMIAQHVYPELEVGKLGFREGMYMASADEIYLTVKGEGGHGALPHKNIDPILIAANILTELQQVSSRFAPPTIPTVLSFGKIIGNGATNVIPDEVLLEGTLRTMNEEWRTKFHERVTAICQHVAKAHGGSCVVDIRKGYPFLVNDIDCTSAARKSAEDFLGKEQVVDLDLRMTAEDFAYFSQKSKVCFYRLGVGNSARGITHSVHHPQFDIDERALEIGMASMAYITIEQLRELNQQQ
jgi:amidohydrolase